MTDTNELLPCPFCGAKTGYAAAPALGKGRWVIQCGDCRAEGPTSSDNSDAGEAEAIAAWNRRVAPPPGGSGEGVEKALANAARWFRGCEQQHRSNLTAEGTLKADTNAERAAYLEAELAALSPAPALDDEVLDAVAEAIVGKIGHFFFGRTCAAVSRELAEVAINAYLAKQEPRT